MFDEMPDRNVVSWSTLISGLAHHGRPREALTIFSSMHREGFTLPNEYTLVGALHACSLSENLVHAYQVYAFIVRVGFGSNIFIGNVLLTALIRHGKLDEALEVFDNLSCKDVVSWNAVMAGYLQFFRSDLPNFFRRMNSEGERPDNYTFASVLTGVVSLLDLDFGVQVHGQITKSGYVEEVCLGNAILEMYRKNQKLKECFKAFHEMPFRNVSSWTQMASGCLNCGEPGKALEVIALMKATGLMPNKFTLATALNACANLSSLEEGKKNHGLRIKLGSEVDVCADNALLDMYSKSGCMDSARLVFESMSDRSVISWTTMIMGCARNGQVKEALAIFDDMKTEGSVEPNSITFVCLFYACGQGGLVSEGKEYFSSMITDYGISPLQEHYACIVNLLGRTGHIKEAEEFILEMPFKPGALIWQTLLSSCVFHGKIESAKRAAKQAWALDGEDPSTYVTLSNVFAGESHWENVGMLRDIMEAMDVRKSAGSSWIGVGKNRPPIDLVLGQEEQK